MNNTVYIVPYHIGDNMVSFAYSDDDIITQHENVHENVLYELASKYKRVITLSFNTLFKIKAHNEVIDVSYLQKLYNTKFSKFLEVNNDNNVIAQYKKHVALIDAKINAFKSADNDLINTFEFIPYQFIMLQHHMQELLTAYMNYIKFVDNEFITNNDIAYYNNMFINYQYVYSNLEKATINIEFANKIRNMSNVVDNMLLVNSNIMQIPKYDLFSAKTGRPYICKGINYQQLSSKYATVIKSRWNNGKIYELDYNACEVRTAFFATKQYDKANSKLDIYEHFIDVFAKNNVKLDRKTIKLFIISMLFGASAKSLAKSIKINEFDTKNIISIINDEFNLSVIKNAITNDINACNYFHNAFGRPIYSDTVKITTLIQNYIQSTAIDICHAGYASIISYMKDNNLNSHVLFTKHDAITIDMHPDELFHVGEMTKLLSTPVDNVEFKINKREICDV